MKIINKLKEEGFKRIAYCMVKEKELTQNMHWTRNKEEIIVLFFQNKESNGLLKSPIFVEYPIKTIDSNAKIEKNVKKIDKIKPKETKRIKQSIKEYEKNIKKIDRKHEKLCCIIGSSKKELLKFQEEYNLSAEEKNLLMCGPYQKYMFIFDVLAALKSYNIDSFIQHTFTIDMYSHSANIVIDAKSQFLRIDKLREYFDIITLDFLPISEILSSHLWKNIDFLLKKDGIVQILSSISVFTYIMFIAVDWDFVIKNLEDIKGRNRVYWHCLTLTRKKI